jgi:hypothetical protein
VRLYYKLPLCFFLVCEATHVVEHDQWAVDAADGVVANPRLDRHHAGVDHVRHDGGGERFVWGEMLLGRCVAAAVDRDSYGRGRQRATMLEVKVEVGCRSSDR